MGMSDLKAQLSDLQRDMRSQADIWHANAKDAAVTRCTEELFQFSDRLAALLVGEEPHQDKTCTPNQSMTAREPSMTGNQTQSPVANVVDTSSIASGNPQMAPTKTTSIAASIAGSHGGLTVSTPEHAAVGEEPAADSLWRALKYWEGKKYAVDAVRPNFTSDQLRELEAGEARLLALAGATRHAQEPAADPQQELLADLRELQSLYDSDRVAQPHARQIERIFDKWLSEKVQSQEPAADPNYELKESRKHW